MGVITNLRRGPDALHDITKGLPNTFLLEELWCMMRMRRMGRMGRRKYHMSD